MDMAEFYSSCTNDELIHYRYQILEWVSKVGSRYDFCMERWGLWSEMIIEELKKRGINHC